MFTLPIIGLDAAENEPFRVLVINHVFSLLFLLLEPSSAPLAEPLREGGAHGQRVLALPALPLRLGRRVRIDVYSVLIILSPCISEGGSGVYWILGYCLFNSFFKN